MKFASFRNDRLSRRDALRRAGVATVGVGILPVLQACGGEQEPTPEPEPETAPTNTAPAAATQPSADAAASPAAAAPGENIVEMNDQLRFAPDALAIKVGETVTWTTVGAIPHTATADPAKAQDPAHVELPEGAEPWDSGIVTSGESWSYTFEVPGDYAYFCIPHEAAGMLATLTVTE